MKSSFLGNPGQFLRALASWLLLAASALAADDLTANWIWHPRQDVTAYNQTVVARRQFKLRAPAAATLKITADSWYRLYLNGAWVNDGPCRSWPEHFQFDTLDVTPYLRDGANEIRVVTRYFGVGDFHHVPRQAGLLAQLDVTGVDGRSQRIITDRRWEMARAAAWAENTPKVSIQMEPAEWYDARLEDRLDFQRARVLFAAHEGPWKDLRPRDVALMTRQPFSPKTFLGARVVRSPGLDFCLPAARLNHPGLIEANHSVSLACGMATVLRLTQAASFGVQADGFNFAIAGQSPRDGKFSLGAGDYLVLAFARDVTSHNKEKSLRFSQADLAFENPLDPKRDNPWVFLEFPEAQFATNDLVWISYLRDNPVIAGQIDAFSRLTEGYLREVGNPAAFRQVLAARARQLPAAEMFVQDSTWQTWQREVVRDGAEYVRNPAAAMHNMAEATVVSPCADGDIELLYDLGEQNCGYYNFGLTAPAGVVVDIVGVEYLAPDGRVQWSYGNRNGLRYLTKEGANQFTSLKRRSGRYLFVTLRNLRAPVSLRYLTLIESTYPVDAIGSFSCSDARLDNIWAISARTLKLCMEDTYTDCPLYEQTHWVGDARNESMFGYTVFGALDLGQHCARQTAQSLERFPIAGCQVPSCWECLLPAWSFLWGISTWDCYWYSADRDFLREMHPAVIRNLQGAERLVNERGLFSGPFWNMFDWSGIDQDQPTVLHNTMFLVGAIDAALRSEEALGCTEHGAWLKSLRSRTVQGVNALWDPAKQAYPDAVRRDGSLSPSTSQHTSFLSVLYDIIAAEHVPAARRNLLDPPEKMVRIGSPFAALYLYEALEKLGLEDAIVKQIYANYLPMLEAGATTVWESFPSGTTGSGGFPTRSHCHAWSSAPVYFLNRIVLGVKSTTPGWRTAIVSPRPGDLTWARGTTATPHGPITVSWKREGNALNIQCQAPAAVKTAFAPNDALKGLQVNFNGQLVQSP